jgi:hypothetical protein
MRKRNWTDEIVAQFAPGTLAEIASVLRPGETRINLVRMAVDREIARRRAYRRERAAKKQQENEQQPRKEKPPHGESNGNGERSRGYVKLDA